MYLIKRASARAHVVHMPSCFSKPFLPSFLAICICLPLSAFFEQVVRSGARILRGVFRSERFSVVAFPAPKQTEPLEHRGLALFVGRAVVQERGAARAAGGGAWSHVAVRSGSSKR